MTPPHDGAALAERVAQRLSAVRGVEAVALGGSFARGTADAASDLDLGIYYRQSAPPDVPALRALAAQLDDTHRADAVTAPGDWGPWINGGAWLTVDGRRVDWLYREIERIESVIGDCLRGRFTTDYQPGHPHGFHSYMYLAEVVLARPLRDPNELLLRLKRQATGYPPLLRDAVIERFLWEARFALEVAEKPVGRGEAWYVAGAVFRSVACLVQVLYAVNERHFLNEKGALAEVMTFARRPDAFADSVERALATLGSSIGQLQARIVEMRRLVAAVEAVAAERELRAV